MFFRWGSAAGALAQAAHYLSLAKALEVSAMEMAETIP